jgi:phosphoenolpyruvate synthase/pyruvate phosphate dikinase
LFILTGAAIAVQKEGIAIKPKILMPTSFSENELKRLVPLVTESIAQTCVQSALVVDPKDTDIRYEVGIDIACPRACVKMNKFLEGEELVTFVNIDTDDLTQLVFGVSKEESPRYMVRHIYFILLQL